MGFVVRACTPKDLKDVMRLVEEIAVIYHVPVNKLATSVEVLEKHGFGEKPKFECFVAEVPPEQKSKEGHTIIGYTLFTYTYNTWRGKNVYIDNLYVMPEFREEPGCKRGLRRARSKRRQEQGSAEGVGTQEEQQTPKISGRRIGKTLSSVAAAAAWQKGCTQLRMHISADKPELIEYQKRYGGENLTETEGWNLFRIYNPVLRGMAAQSKF